MTHSNAAASVAAAPTLTAEERARVAPDRVFVGFSTTAIFLSALIRKVSNAQYSHAWLCHGSRLWGGAWVTQADYPTVHSWTFEKATSTWSKLMVYEVSPAFYGEVREAMIKSRRVFEEKFDLQGLFFMAVVTLVKKWTHRRIGNWLAHPNQLFCSEFVEVVLKATGEAPFDKWEPQDSSPKQVYEACGREAARFRKVHPDEFRQWLGDVGVDVGKIPPTLIAESLGPKEFGADSPKPAGHPL